MELKLNAVSFLNEHVEFSKFSNNIEFHLFNLDINMMYKDSQCINNISKKTLWILVLVKVSSFRREKSLPYICW